jgi:septal ring factor EnvC (AmiA/AmiB activator)
MTKMPKQLEKNVSASFAYVKKDMLMLNDAFSSLQDKIQHLSLNHAILLEEIEKLRKEISEKQQIEKADKEELEFYDLKEKKKFKSKNYKIITKSGKKFAVTTSPTGTKSYRIIGSSTKKKSTTKKKTSKKK